MEIETTKLYHIPIRMAKISNTDIIKCGWDYEGTETLIHFQWELNASASLKGSVALFLNKTTCILTMCMCAKSLQLCPTLWDPIWPRNHTIWYLPKTGKILCWTCTWMFVAALFIIHQKLETINMSFSKWVNKQIVVLLNNGILLSVNRSIKPQKDKHVHAQSCLTLLFHGL